MRTWFLLIVCFVAGTLRAEERFLLAADTQVIEVNREGRLTDLLKHPGHSGIYEAWRLPDGGVAYVHRGGLAVFDGAKKLIMEYAAARGEKGVEANSCAVLGGGSRFALLDSGANLIRTVDRSGAVVLETPVPDLSNDPLHFRYRTVREVPGANAFWVCQYARKTLLKVESGTGNILQSILIGPLLNPTAAVQKAFALTQCRDGTLLVSTSTGCQLLRINAEGERLACWTSHELGISCRYLLGMQSLENGNVLVACGDYHLKTPEEGGDLLVELDAKSRIVWRLTRSQLVDQIEGSVDKGSGIEEMRVTNVHAYDSEHLRECLHVWR
jgi:hypothetical protein